MDDLIQNGFWVNPKITFPNKCKPVHDVIIILVSSDPLNLELEMNEKKNKLQEIGYLENYKSFSDEKIHFS